MRKMTRTHAILGVLLAALAVGAGRSAKASALQAAQAPLSGEWTLDHAASQLPREIGFGINWQTSGESGSSGGGSRGGQESGGATRNFVAPRESAEDAARLRTLTDEVRAPSEHLTIADTPTAITISGDDGWTRTFHLTGRQEVLRLAGDVPLVTAARRDGDRLVVTYDVEENRQIRYTYSVSASPRQLIVETRFLDRGKGNSVTRVYNASAAPAEPVKPARPAGPPAGAPLVPATAPAAPQAAPAPKPDLTPGAELRGLTKLGVVVEGLGSQAVACGLAQDALDKAVSKSLSDAGLQIARNSDEDTYLYVNVMAATAGGTCVSRYDVTLYTHTTATLPYTARAVLVQVELLHKSGMAGGAPAANAQAVVRGVKEAVDQFVARIREVNGK